MATKVEETPSPPTGSPWYGKIFECWRSRSRVSPGRIELPDCDFFIVAPRRTLRVLKPSLKSIWYYESTAIDRPESVNDNFFARWTRRPHPSGNCRCSFRQSTGTLSTTEEQIISAELNRIRTSLCEGEKNARDLEELEQKVSVNLQKLRDNAVADRINEANETTVPSTLTDRQSFEQNAKQQIVKDLERYINTLLEEVLDDTVKHVTNMEKNDVQHPWQKTKNNLKSQSNKLEHKISIKRDKDFIDINSRVPINKTQWSAKNECKKQFARVSVGEGYVNPAFVDSTDELASLDFDHSTKKRADLYFGMSGNTESIAPEKLDCVDSGINSVETIEFQLLDQEPSFEQSLLRMIDEKLGRDPLTNNSEEDNSEKNLRKAISEMNSQETVQTSSNLEILSTDPDKVEYHEDTINTETNFEKLRLEFQSNGTPLNDGSRSKLDTKLTETAPIELKDYRKEWTEFDSISSRENTRRSLRDSIMFRRNRKPTIVFLHGFGSSAEIFEHQLQYFSSHGYPCIAPDMLGHGMSSAPGRSRDYHFSKLLKDLDAILHHYAFKSGEKCVLVAHNYGCSFATALACKYDSNIHQLVLISGGGPTPLAPPSTECAGHCCLRAILAPFLMCGLHRDILYSARGRQHPYCGHESTEQWPSHMKYVLNGMIWPQGDYAFHRKICTPTLLVHGLRDNKVSLVQECQMERTMVKAFLEAIPMAGHSPMTECPQQLNHMIHCFIDLWKNKKWQQ